MRDIPTDVLVRELERIVAKMQRSWVKNDSLEMSVLELYVRDLRNELASREIVDTVA